MQSLICILSVMMRNLRRSRFVHSCVPPHSSGQPCPTSRPSLGTSVIPLGTALSTTHLRIHTLSTCRKTSTRSLAGSHAAASLTRTHIRRTSGLTTRAHTLAALTWHLRVSILHHSLGICGPPVPRRHELVLHAPPPIKPSLPSCSVCFMFGCAVMRPHLPRGVSQSVCNWPGPDGFASHSASSRL